MARSRWATAPWVAALTALWCCACTDPAVSSPVPAPAVADAVTHDTGKDATKSSDTGAIGSPSKAKPGAPVIAKVDPDEGPSSGTQVVTISGQHLGEAWMVLFGDTPAMDLFVIDDGTLQVTVPPRPAGIVDVTVRSVERPDATLAAAYRYVAEVSLSAISPAQGPAQGGTAVMVSGSGFLPGTQFVVGDRLAIGATVIDEHTASFLTPPGTAGKVNVFAVNADGQGKLSHAFWYRTPPLLQSVTPATGPTGGAPPVTLTGTGLLGSGVQVRMRQGDPAKGGTEMAAEILSMAADGTSVKVQPPAVQEAGTWDVRFGNIDGTSQLDGAYHFVAPGSGTAILGVSPAVLPLNQLSPVAVAISTSLSAAQFSNATVQFGSLQAKVLSVLGLPGSSGAGLTLMVQPPAVAEPAQVNVTCSVSTAQLLLKGGFTYTAAAPKIVAVVPNLLDAGGGTPVSVQVQGDAGHGGVVGLRLGALQASQVKTVAATAGQASLGLSAIAPKGSAGPGDVVVRFADGSEASLLGGCQFVPKLPEVVGLTPGRGAQAGGTWVTLVGGGLEHVAALHLGGAKVHTWKVQHTGAILLRTPPGKSGVAALTVTWDNTTQTEVPKAFVYFDPSSGDSGAWGQPIDGALNVTVLQKGQLGAVEGALVVVGDDPQTPLKGTTDAKGQVTLSGVALAGPLHVHAAKTGWTAGSVIAVGVENVTIRLAELPSGSGPPANVDKPTQLPATVTGTVVDADKYTIFPMGSCKGTAAVAGNCKPCSSDAQCLLGATCEAIVAPLPSVGLSNPAANQGEQRFCAAPCTAAADCPANFECRAVGQDLNDAHFRCTPAIGKREIRCEGSSPWIGGGAPSSPKGVADKDGHFTVVVTPGDVAVICRSGYVDGNTGEFVPLTMGLVRHLFLVPGDAVDGVVVPVHVPLDRKMRVKLDRIPMGVDAQGQRNITVGLSLGSEGYVPTGGASTYAVTDTLVVERQPALSLWAGENGDLRYETYGGLAQAYGGPPLSLSQSVGIDPRGLDRYARAEPGAKQAIQSDAPSGTLLQADAAGQVRVAVGDDGRILAWTGGGFTQQASPTGQNLRAVWLAPEGNGDGWIGSESGLLLRRGGLGWVTWGSVGNRDIVAISGRAHDDAWLVDSASQLWHWDGAGWTPVVGPWGPAPIQPGKYDPTPPHKQVRAIWHSPGGKLWLAGDEGTLLRASWTPAQLPDAPTPAAQWEDIGGGTWLGLRGIWGSGDNDVWVCGEHGHLAHWNGLKTQVISTGTTQVLLGLRGTGKGLGVEVVGGQGTWLRVQPGGDISDLSPKNLRVDLRAVIPTFDGGFVAVGEPVLVMGPYLEMPALQLPAPGQSLSGPGGSNKVVWTANPGIDPTLNIVRLADGGYQTRWEIFVRGGVTVVALPDFEALGLASPLPPGTNYVRLWRVYNTGINIDSFSFKGLSSASWKSWAYMVRSTDEPPWSPGQPVIDPPWPPK